METSIQLAIVLPMSDLEEFCQRWRIQELAVFGWIIPRQTLQYRCTVNR